MKAALRNGLIALAAVLGCLVIGSVAGAFGAWMLVLTPRPSAGEHTVTVCTTTDLHGAYFPENYDGSANATSLANVSSAMKALREEGDRPVLIDVGDNLQGDNAAYYYNYVDTTSKHLFVSMAKYLAYDAIVVGNHDIETGHRVYDRVKRQHRRAPLLAANAIHTHGILAGKPYFKPYKVIVRDRFRIAVIGMTNANIKAWLSEEKWSGIDFLPISDVAQQWVDKVRKRTKPDLVVLAVHSGSGTGEGPDIENEARYLAANLKGVDLVLCGHDHRPLTETFIHEDGTQTLLIDAGTKARQLGVATFRIDVEKHRIKAKTGIAELLDMRSYEPDPDFTERFSRQFETVRDYALRPVGSLTAPLSFEDALEGPSAYMSLIHKTQLHYSGADVSISAPLNNRGSLPEGPVTFLDLTRIYRYENLLYTVELTGAQLQGYLEYSYDHWIRRDGSSYNYDSAAGIRYTVNCSAPYGQRVAIESMTDGRPFDPEATYSVAMTSYRASGAGNLLSEGAGVDPDSLSVTAVFKDIRSLIGDYLSQGPYTPTADDNWAFIR